MGRSRMAGVQHGQGGARGEPEPRPGPARELWGMARGMGVVCGGGEGAEVRVPFMMDSK